MTVDFSGTWAYRSLVNSPDLTLPFNDLAFGAGTLELTEPAACDIGGTLGGPTKINFIFSCIFPISYDFQ